jgi:PAS domain-containing protein
MSAPLLPSEHELEVLARLMQNAPYPVLICNSHGHIVSANDAARSIYGRLQNSDSMRDWTKIAEVRDVNGRQLRPHEYPLHRALLGQVVNDEAFTVITADTRSVKKIRVTAHQLRDGDRLVGAISLHRH